MKNKIILIAATCYVMASISQAQTFISSYTEYVKPGMLAITTTNGSSPYYPTLDFNVSKTLAIDPENSIVRFSGQTAAITTSFTYTTQAYTQLIATIPPIFPNPPAQIFATGTATAIVEFNFPMTSFDTGNVPFGWNGSAYAFAPTSLGTIQGTADIILSVTSEGYTTTSHQVVDMILNLSSSGAMWVAGYPNSSEAYLTIQPQSSKWPMFDLPRITTENGFYSDFALVPEPSQGVLCTLSVGLLQLRRRRA